MKSKEVIEHTFVVELGVQPVQSLEEDDGRDESAFHREPEERCRRRGSQLRI